MRKVRWRETRSRALAVACVGAWLLLGLVMTPSALASRTGGKSFSWRSVGTIDSASGSMMSISCPAVSLCVAVDAHRHVLTSTNPRAGGRAWSSATIDGAHNIDAVSCPSTSLCVAADDSGNVLTSRDPTAGARSWTIANVDKSNAIYPIDCPSASLCVAGDSQGNVLTSTDPSVVGAAWQIGLVDTSQDYECYHYGGSQCTAVGYAPSGISCPSASFCVLVDSAQGEYTSHDPAAGASSWTGRPSSQPISEGFPGLACPSAELCLTTTNYDAQAVTWNPNAPGPAYQFTTLNVSFQLLGPACASTTTCFLADGDGDLLGSDDPAGSANAWKPLYHDPGAVINVISCPTASSCFAVDSNGKLLIGAAAPPPARIKAELHAMLLPLKRARLGALLRRGGFRLSFEGPVAGHIKLTLDLAAHQHTRADRRSRLILIESTTQNYRRSGTTAHYAINLNRTGQRLLAHLRSATLKATAQLLTNGRTLATETQAYALTAG